MTLQRDYGGFDPAFFGVTITLSGEEDWNLYRKLRTGQNFPVEGHYSKDGLFDVLQLATVAAHETRHFHDFLIAPHSARVFRARINMALNSLQLLGSIVNSGANCLPFPISRWCGLDANQRKAQMKGWGEPPAGGWTVMPMPQITPAMVRSLDPKKPLILKQGDDAIKTLILGGMWYKGRLDELAWDSSHVGDKQEVQSWEVLELSSLLVQMADIYNFENGRGYGWPERFLEHISTTDTSRYGDILRLATALWRWRGETFDPYRTSLMVYWLVDPWRLLPGRDREGGRIDRNS